MTTEGEGPGAATPRPSEPIAHQNEQDNTRMTDNPFPVDPTGPLGIGSIPEEDLGRIIDRIIGGEQ